MRFVAITMTKRAANRESGNVTLPIALYPSFYMQDLLRYALWLSKYSHIYQLYCIGYSLIQVHVQKVVQYFFADPSAAPPPPKKK